MHRFETATKKHFENTVFMIYCELDFYFEYWKLCEIFYLFLNSYCNIKSILALLDRFDQTSDWAVERVLFSVAAVWLMERTVTYSRKQISALGGTCIGFVVPDYATKFWFQYAAKMFFEFIEHLLGIYSPIIKYLNSCFSKFNLTAKRL